MTGVCGCVFRGTPPVGAAADLVEVARRAIALAPRARVGKGVKCLLPRGAQSQQALAPPGYCQRQSCWSPVCIPAIAAASWQHALRPRGFPAADGRLLTHSMHPHPVHSLARTLTISIPCSPTQPCIHSHAHALPCRYLSRVDTAVDALKRRVGDAPITMLSHSVRFLGYLRMCLMCLWVGVCGYVDVSVGGCMWVC